MLRSREMNKTTNGLFEYGKTNILFYFFFYFKIITEIKSTRLNIVSKKIVCTYCTKNNTV